MMLMLVELHLMLSTIGLAFVWCNICTTIHIGMSSLALGGVMCDRANLAWISVTVSLEYCQHGFWMNNEWACELAIFIVILTPSAIDIISSSFLTWSCSTNDAMNLYLHMTLCWIHIVQHYKTQQQQSGSSSPTSYEIKVVWVSYKSRVSIGADIPFRFGYVMCCWWWW